MYALAFRIAASGFDAGKGTQVAVVAGTMSFVFAVLALVWSRLERNVGTRRRWDISIQEQVDAVETEKHLTRWAARFGVIGGACWAAAMVLFMVWLSA